MRKLFRRLLKKRLATGSKQVTSCCEQEVEMVKVGEEVFLRCSKCYGYIGHVVGRKIAVLCAHYPQYIYEACRDRQICLLPTEDELEDMYDQYCECLLKFAKQAAVSTLREYIPAE